MVSWQDGVQNLAQSMLDAGGQVLNSTKARSATSSGTGSLADSLSGITSSVYGGSSVPTGLAVTSPVGSIGYGNTNNNSGEQTNGTVEEEIKKRFPNGIGWVIGNVLRSIF